MPPGSGEVTLKATPPRKAAPLKLAGRVLTQAFCEASKVVLAAAGVVLADRVMTESGTATVYAVLLAVKLMVWLVTWMVAGPAPRPAGLKALLNQTVRPAGMPLPLNW